ncbi:MAG: hypothetical protein KDA61_14510, partial [Planctomycetales bacterium]|nr:hypothetical protein [Planctomycetales bacterium]
MSFLPQRRRPSNGPRTKSSGRRSRFRTSGVFNTGRQSTVGRRTTLELLEARWLLAGDSFEPNDSFGSASVLGTGDQLHTNLSIHVGGDVDYYKWTASGDGTAIFDALFLHAQGDLELEVYDAAFQRIGVSATQSNNERIVLPVTAGSDYYVKAFEFTTILTQPDYDLQITEILPDVYESGVGNDTSVNAAPLTVGTYSGLTIHRSGNEDWYSFVAPTDGNLRVDALFSHALGNLDLKLFDSGLSEINSSGGSVDNEMMVEPLTSGQLVYIRAIGEGGDIQHDYDLQLAFSQPPVISSIPSISVFPGQTGSAEFTVSDPDTAVELLVLAGVPDNPQVVPTGNVWFEGSGATRTLFVKPTSSSGFTDIDVTVTDPEGNSATTTVSFSVGGFSFNFAPTISDIPGQTTSEDSPLAAINFTVGDFLGDVDLLTFTVTSSDQSLVPDGNLAVSGTGANRTLSITPAPNVHGGPATITVVVTDPEGLSATDTFPVTISPAVADTPNLSVSTAAGNEDTAIPLTINASLVDTDGSERLSLSISGVPAGAKLSAGIDQGGGVWDVAPSQLPGLTITPPLNSTAGFTLNVTATATETSVASSASASASLGVTVNAVPDAPTITSITSQATLTSVPLAPLAFTIDDAETPATALTVTANSSNAALVPNLPANLTLGGSGASRTLTVTPAPGQVGTSLITLTVTDGAAQQAVETFLLTVRDVNTAPTITAIADVTIGEDLSTAALAFTVDDGTETAAGALAVFASTSNATLVPVENIVLAGVGASRTVVVTPAANQTGSATISLLVDDGDGGHATEDFLVTVTAANDAPTISTILSQSTPVDTATGALAFLVDDIETPASSLVVTATSSNATLVPNLPANLTLGGSGAARTLTVTPATGESGTTTITLTVDDGTTTSTSQFVLSVGNTNTAPTISDVADLSVNEDTATAAIPFTVSDGSETLAGDLTVSAASSNPALVPLENIVFGGSGTNRTVTLTPAADQVGSTTITLTVDDGDGGHATDTFLLTVNAVGDAPTITPLASQSTLMGVPLSPLPFV